MIIFNNAGHCFLSAPVSQEPIIWVDAQDISTYTLGSASSLGNELVVNGDFSDGLNGWIFGVGWSVTNGVAFCDGTQSGFTRLEQTVLDIPNNGKTYIITVEGVSITQGQLSIGTSAGGFRILNVNDSGTFTHIFNNTFDSEAGVVGGIDFIGSVSNISVKEVLAYDVTNLDNKGELGGVMTLNGTVKFANGGFESWSTFDYITRGLGEPFITTNSFTMVATFNLKDVTSGGLPSRNTFSDVRLDNQNQVYFIRFDSLMYDIDYRNLTNAIFETSEPYKLGLQTLIYTYDVNTGSTIKLMSSGIEFIFTYTNEFEGNLNSVVHLLNNGSATNQNSGQNNPLHEFRLYNRAMSLVEMQDLQAELNDKYIQLGNELVVNGDFSDGLNGWSNFDNALSLNLGGCKITRTTGFARLTQNFNFIANKQYKLTYDILENNNCIDFATIGSVSDGGTGISLKIPSSIGSHQVDIKFNDDYPFVAFLNQTDNSDITIDNISVKEILN